MRSATSYFNKTLFRHDLAQFWPLWFGYTLTWLFIGPIALFTNLSQSWYTPAEFDVSADVVRCGVSGGAVIGAAFSLLFAMAMFSYLCIPRATLGLHALPARRETLFVTSYLAGLFCLLTTLVLTFALMGVVTASYGWGDSRAVLTALLAAVLNAVFFYSFGVLCMVMTGQILAAPVFYVIGNVLAAGMEILLRTFAGNFLYGYTGSACCRFGFLSPAYYILTHTDVDIHYEDRLDASGEYLRTVQTGWDVSGLGILAAYAFAGLVLAALSLALYRRRRSELTGAVVTFPWAFPVFKYGVSFCTAVALGQLVYYILYGQHLCSGEYSLLGTILCMVFCGLLGYYSAEMLIKKSAHIFKTSLRGALAVTLVLIALGISMTFDLTGYERRVPEADEISDVYISFGGETHFTAADPAEIEKITALHRTLIAHKDELLALSHDGAMEDSSCRTVYLTLSYSLKNGTMLSRNYDVTISRDALNESGSVTQALNEAYTCESAVFCRILGCDAAAAEQELRFTGGYYATYELFPDGTDYSTTLTAEQTETLFAALERDANALCRDSADIFTCYERESIAWVELYANYTDDAGRRSEEYYCVEVYGDMTQTLDALTAIRAVNENERAAGYELPIAAEDVG